MAREVVLVTGGSGFLGQHIVKELQDADDVDEIRVLDVELFRNKLGYEERTPVKSILGDVNTLTEIQAKDCFGGVSSVIHSAALVSHEYPPDSQALQDNNVEGTKKLLSWCLQFKVKRLVFTSTAEVVMSPVFNNGFFTIIINQTEAKAVPPESPRNLVFGEYAASKLQAEYLVLQADNSTHPEGEGVLRTVAIRPTFLYGAGDTKLLAQAVQFATDHGALFWRIGGVGGRHQFVYAGNAAYAHVCGLRALRGPRAAGVAGLPVFITDDTQVDDMAALGRKLTCSPDGRRRLNISSWYIPAVISFLIAVLVQALLRILSPRKKLPIGPTALVTYLSSMILFNRLRASVHLGYSPKYSADEAVRLSAPYYRTLTIHSSHK